MTARGSQIDMIKTEVNGKYLQDIVTSELVWKQYVQVSFFLGGGGGTPMNYEYNCVDEWF